MLAKTPATCPLSACSPTGQFLEDAKCHEIFGVHRRVGIYEIVELSV